MNKIQHISAGDIIKNEETSYEGFASIMYRKTGDILLVSKLLGHAKADMTVQYYLIDDIDEMQHKFNRVA